MQYLGRRGNYYYLLDEDSNEAYSFDSFVESVNSLPYLDARIKINNTISRVELVSILGEPLSRVCEVYFNGYTAQVPKGYKDVYSILVNALNLHTRVFFRINRSTSQQIILATKQESTSRETLGALLGIFEWVKV